MQYRRLGSSGLQLSALSYGAWVTFGHQLGRGEARELIAQCLDAGVNFFDNAEVYAHGEAERIMGDVLVDLRVPRDAFCVSSKVFFGAVDPPAPTQRGLSRKHVRDACDQALARLRVDYLDLYLCHRPDPEVSIAEVVTTMDLLVRQGKVLYWGTSEWPAALIRDAIDFANARGLFAPQVEQPQYNLLNRANMERELAPLCAEHGLGTTIWSPLASGLLSGKYAQGVPEDSRLNTPGYGWLRELVLARREEVSRGLAQFAAISAEIGVPQSTLAIAWCLRNPQVSTVMLGATKRVQLDENFRALDLAERLDADLAARIESCFPSA
ncbi:MAG TPA: aldo/keto reductase [Patescibacteria group bacterium]|nr:aldo/keto reductase [Patescibacteria group bacterium]